MSTLDYEGSQVHNTNCYSTIDEYGCKGSTKGKIWPPTPASIQPAMFAHARPHKSPFPVDAAMCRTRPHCPGYRTLETMNSKTPSPR